MWPLIAGGVLYLSYLAASGEWRSLLFRPRDIRGAIEMQKYYLRLRKEHPPQGKHNPLQKAAYTFIILLGVLSVVTGFAIYQTDAALVAHGAVRRISGGALLALLGGVDLHGLSHRPRAAGVRRGSGIAAGDDQRLVSRPIPQP